MLMIITMIALQSAGSSDVQRSVDATGASFHWQRRSATEQTTSQVITSQHFMDLDLGLGIRSFCSRRRNTGRCPLLAVTSDWLGLLSADIRRLWVIT